MKGLVALVCLAVIFVGCSEECGTKASEPTISMVSPLDKVVINMMDSTIKERLGIKMVVYDNVQAFPK